jgi:hypothetical protein
MEYRENVGIGSDFEEGGWGRKVKLVKEEEWKLGNWLGKWGGGRK